MTAKPENVQEALEDRDPNNLNQHVQIVWDDIIGEPEGARSPECAWRLSHACFRHSRNLCYTVLAVLIAPPCALFLGCGFACLAFEIGRRLSNTCFRHSRNLCYTVLAVLIAPPCALFLGCGFACLAFEIGRRLSNTCFRHSRNLCYTVLAVLIAPPCALFLAIGRRLSNTCFRHSRNLCYTVLAVLIAPPCALFLGCGFACLAFEQIWCTAPCIRCVKIYFASLRTIVQACMAATVAPAAEAVGHVCRHIRVNLRKDAPEERDILII
ncbi:uncharacterized protein LOC110383123 [Helicoverpa armigera]|uniref:uncharacterized protein LOC110383123 n=1 Tax=Helicoverpa armigera TaxID=29058 RepID=UPI00308344E0